MKKELAALLILFGSVATFADGMSTTDGQSVLISDHATDDSGELRFKMDTQYDYGSVSVNVKYATDENQTAYLTLFGSSTSTKNAVADLKMDEGYKENSGNVGIQLRGDADYDKSTVTEYEAGEWVNIYVEWDTPSGIYTIIVDEEEVGTFDMFNTSGVQTISLKVGSNSKVTTSDMPFYVDDLVIYADNSDGTTEMLADDFEDYDVDTELGSDYGYNGSTFEAVVVE